MRWYALGLVALTLSACGSQYKGHKPVVDNWERVSGWSGAETSRARYTGAPVLSSPIVPFMAFGATFDLDVEVQTKNPRYNRHQVGRIATPDGPFWLALETRASDGEQVLLAEVEAIDSLMPELPLERRRSVFQVEDQSDGEHVALQIRYENADGDPVRLEVESNTPWRVERRRNASTEGQSPASVVMVGDLAARQSAFKTQIEVNGAPQRVRKVGGFVPYQFVGTQAFGGLAAGEFRVRQSRVFSFDSSVSDIVVHGPDLPPAEPVVQEEAPAAPDPLEVALAGNRDALQSCYTAQAEGNPDLAGQVLVSFKVEGGAGSNLSVVQNTTEDEALAGCLTDALEAWSFPEELSGDYGFPFTFIAGKGLQLAEAEEEGRKKVRRRGEEEAEEPRDETDLDDLVELPAGDAVAALPEEDVVEAPPVDPAYGPTLGAFSTLHTMSSGNVVEMPWEVTRRGERVYAVQHTDVRTLTYEYLVRHDALELYRISVTQYGHTIPSVEIAFSPALPDLRRPFDGRQRSRFVMDVNGQRGHGVGTAEAWWTESGVKLRVAPEAPEWAAGRNLVTDISLDKDEALVRVRRVE